MANALELVVANFAPMLQKMIPPMVWDAVVDNVKRMADKVASIDARLAAIETQNAEILARLPERPMPPSEKMILDQLRPITLEEFDGTAVPQNGHNGTGATVEGSERGGSILGT